MKTEDSMFAEVSVGGDAGAQQCLRCGALVGGWSFQIGDGVHRHRQWHLLLDAALARATPEEV